jgi:hypothetical protein
MRAAGIAAGTEAELTAEYAAALAVAVSVSDMNGAGSVAERSQMLVLRAAEAALAVSGSSAANEARWYAGISSMG